MRTIKLLIFHNDWDGQYILINSPGLLVAEDSYLLDPAWSSTTVRPGLLAAVTQHLTEQYCLQAFAFFRSWTDVNTGHDYVLVEFNQSYIGGSETSQPDYQDTTSQVPIDSQCKQFSQTTAEDCRSDHWNPSQEDCTTIWQTSSWDSDNSDSGSETSGSTLVWPTTIRHSERSDSDSDSDSDSQASTINWPTPVWACDNEPNTWIANEPDDTWSIDSSAGSNLASPPGSILKSYPRKDAVGLEAGHSRREHAHRVYWADDLHPWPYEYLPRGTDGTPI